MKTGEKMQFGTNLFFEAEVGYPVSMRAAAKAGFKNVDFDLTEHNDPPYDIEERFFKEVKNIADGEGITLNQAHAPYVKGLRSDFSYFESADFTRRIRDSVRRAGMLGIPYIVVHPFEPYPAGYDAENVPLPAHKVMDVDLIERNVNVFSRFKEDLKEYNVKMAVENCFLHDFLGRKPAPQIGAYSAEMNALIDLLGDENYCVCFDCGHLNLLNNERIADYLDNVGGRVKVLHLQDNFGIQNDWFGELDRHLLPFIGSLDWQNLAESLKRINYNGVYSFELSPHGNPALMEDMYNYTYKAANLIFGAEKE